MKRIGCYFVCLLVLVAHGRENTSADAVGEPIAIQLKTQRNEILTEPVYKDGPTGNRSIVISGDQFLLDGRPLRIVSGSMHYFRLPAAYWRDRLRKLRAAGLNSVTTYVEWSYHEPEERQYIFDGDRDIVKFIQIAAEEGLHVLLRPGPYICAERDLGLRPAMSLGWGSKRHIMTKRKDDEKGGLPYWLLGKYTNMRLRTTDPNFIYEASNWFNKLFELLTPLLYGNGGPIILVQVENEYGSYGSDMAYKEKIRDLLRRHVGTNAVQFTTDGTARSMFTNGAVPDTLTTIDFGAGTNVRNTFQELRKFMPHGPLMNSEFYTGWLTHWGERFQTADAAAVVKTLRDMLDYNANVNFYMFFGGTNYEFSAGANYGSHYQPDITSYDYDSPLSEDGDPTPKYYLIRDTLKRYNLVDEKMTMPQPSSKGAYGLVSVVPKMNLLSPSGRSQLGKSYGDVEGVVLPTFEKLRQRSGLMLYETTVTDDSEGLLVIQQPKDRVNVFENGVYKGSISRMHKIFSLPLKLKAGSVLSLLVENQGRINYGSMLHDYKGILSPVIFNNTSLKGKWTVTGYPLETVDVSQSSGNVSRGPALYEGYFTIPSDKKILDSFIDTSGWGKGYIWVNGHNLGRYWPSVGPQVTLYLPGVWLKPAPERNFVQIVELELTPSRQSIELIDHPILNTTGIPNPYL